MKHIDGQINIILIKMNDNDEVTFGQEIWQESDKKLIEYSFLMLTEVLIDFWGQLAKTRLLNSEYRRKHKKGKRCNKSENLRTERTENTFRRPWNAFFNNNLNDLDLLLRQQLQQQNPPQQQQQRAVEQLQHQH